MAEALQIALPLRLQFLGHNKAQLHIWLPAVRAGGEQRQQQCKVLQLSEWGKTMGGKVNLLLVVVGEDSGRTSWDPHYHPDLLGLLLPFPLTEVCFLPPFFVGKAVGRGQAFYGVLWLTSQAATPRMAAAGPQSGRARRGAQSRLGACQAACPILGSGKAPALIMSSAVPPCLGPRMVRFFFWEGGAASPPHLVRIIPR